MDKAQDRPTSLSEPRGRVGVARDVAGDLARPVLDVVLEGPPTVVWTAVPEAAIDEHCDALACEDDVGPAA